MEKTVSPTIEAADYVQSKLGDFQPEVALILGSGMGILADEVENPIRIPYSEIPHYPESTVKGHAGRLVAGMLSGKKVLIMQGRIHFYEGHPASVLAFPIRVFHQLGIKTLILTNAAGAVHRGFAPGDLMLITDHINFTFTNPLIGLNDPELGPRFVDNSQTYSPELMQVARNTAEELDIKLKSGVYQFMTGPSYETPAEVDLARTLGADAVGMSTLPEALAANHCGIKVLGISFIANLAAGLSETKLTHEEVMETMEMIKDTFIRLVKGIVQNLPSEGIKN